MTTGFHRILASSALGLVLASPGLAEEWISPCDLAAKYDGMGAEYENYALYYDDICANVGPDPQPQSCLSWGEAFMGATGGLDGRTYSDAELQKLSDDCEAALTEAGLAPDAHTCGDGMLECLPPDDSLIVADDDAVVLEDDGSPVMGVDTGGCGPNMECKPPEDEPVPLADDSSADTAPDTSQAPAPASAPDPALDLAFWDAVRDSGNPVLLQAYVDKFPNGTFVIIAQELLKGLNGQAATPDPTSAPAQAPVAPAPQSAQTPTQLHNEALKLLGEVFSQPVATWNTSAERPIALLRQAAAQGYAPSKSTLGEMYENGIGVPKDPDIALSHYMDAGRGGYLEGYYRALMLMDQFSNRSGYVDTFLTLYRADPGMAVDSLNDVSRAASQWLQMHLRDAGYYQGAIDGAFGSGSKAALQDYVTGAVKPAPVPVVPKADASIAAAMQRELARVGCYDGAIDGKWGPGSTQAMRNFGHWSGEPVNPSIPSQHGLDALKRTPAPVCGVD
ncbi:peptidoglycan-binding domain-containing protein [Aliiroseovarius subalbicans]|uniref:peptidoglycan-binding domain-containing protein n=1 Tax=Aliiroseovarius subalbicans TaxID=2925840 RepID=UPI001F5A0318|nr:peptidoglycan-binding domain-containing protein [Aliiroseovarius subalbicans]MCI2398517.1 hypothetical protein [Aliiroseovarius subalbicans]